MTTATKSRALLLAFLAATLPLALAENPSGNLSLSFDSPDTAVWDLSGFYGFSHDIDGAGGEPAAVAFGIDVSHDARGMLRGAGTTLLSIGADTVAADYTAVGRVSGRAGTTRAVLIIKLRGQDVIAGSLRSFAIVVRENLEVDATGLTLNGTARGSVNVTRLGRANVRTDVSVPLPGGQDGSWSAQMNILPLQRLVGSGAVVVSNGRPFPVNITGSYSSRSDSSRLRLVGTGEGRGTTVSLNFSINGEVTEIISLRGKILGQVVRQ